jgi:hypothetical protein
MPPGGWPSPGTPDAAKLACERHLISKRTSDSGTRINADDARPGIGGGVLVVVAGIIAIAYLGKDYSTCQLLGAGADPHCETTALFHWGGIVVLLIGAVIIARAIISANRK